MLLDRDKCFDKNITKYLDKHQTILINKYNLAKPGSSTSTKTNTLTSRKTKYIKKYTTGPFNSYFRCSPCTTPTPSSKKFTYLTASFHRFWLLLKAVWCHATSLHGAPTQPPRSSIQLSCSLSLRPTAHSPHAALTQADCLLHAAHTQPAHSSNAAAAQPSRC